MPDPLSHYDDRYFVWQRSVGEFAGWADLPHFQRHVRPTDTAADFGCGGKYEEAVAGGLLTGRRGRLDAKFVGGIDAAQQIR